MIEKKILSFVHENPNGVTTEDICEHLVMTPGAVMFKLAKLKASGQIRYDSAMIGGGWYPVEEEQKMTALQHCKDFCYQWAQENWDVIAPHTSEDTLEEFLAAPEKINVAWMITEIFIWGDRTPDKSVFYPVPDQGRIFYVNRKHVRVDWLPGEEDTVKIEFTEKKTRMVEEEYWT